MPWYRAWIIPVKAWMFSHILTQFARNKPQKHIQQLSICGDEQAQRKRTYQHAACIMRIHIRAPTVGGFSRILEISVAQRRDVRPGAGAQARIRAACGGTARNLRRRHACLGRTRRSVAKIAAARRLKARKSDPRRMCSQRHHAAPHSRAPRAAHRAPSRAAKGPRPGPGPVPTGQRPTRARRRRFGALFRANAPCAFSGNPHARSLARSASGGARRPARARSSPKNPLSKLPLQPPRRGPRPPRTVPGSEPAKVSPERARSCAASGRHRATAWPIAGRRGTPVGVSGCPGASAQEWSWHTLTGYNSNIFQKGRFFSSCATRIYDYCVPTPSNMANSIPAEWSL